MIIGVLGTIASQGGVIPYYTEGVEHVAWVEGYSLSTGSQAKNANHLYLLAENAAAVSIRTYVTDAAIDMTNIKTLFIDLENTGDTSNGNRARVCVSTDKPAGGSVYDARVEIQGTFTRQVRTIDVSSLTGKYFIRVHASDLSAAAALKSEIRVFKIWGAK